MPLPISIFEGLGDNPPKLSADASALYLSLVRSNFQYVVDLKSNTYAWEPSFPPGPFRDDLLREIETAVRTGWYLEPDASWTKAPTFQNVKGTIVTPPIQIKANPAGMAAAGIFLLGLAYYFSQKKKK